MLVSVLLTPAPYTTSYCHTSAMFISTLPFSLGSICWKVPERRKKRMNKSFQSAKVKQQWLTLAS